MPGSGDGHPSKGGSSSRAAKGRCTVRCRSAVSRDKGCAYEVEVEVEG